MTDEDRNAEDLIAERRASNPRRTPGRTPLGAEQTRRLLRATIGILVAVTVLLAVVLTIGGG